MSKATNDFMSTFYHRDPTVPFWRANIDVEQLFTANAHRPDRAQAWLDWFYVTDSITSQAVMMRGRFELGLLGYHTFTWSFTPTYTGELAIVLPVYEDFRMVDFLAISRHDPHNIWGCCIGAGKYIGSTTEHRKDRTSPLRVYKTPINWLLANCDGVLPLSKAFMPLLANAPSLIAESYDHACEISELAFIGPAERLGFDCESAEQAAMDKITFEVVA
jgi:hypothetical protein